MADESTLSQWIEGYRRAWESNDRADIVSLFTEDADYRTAPFDPPWHGPGQIADGWLAHADRPGETTFQWRPICVTDEIAVVQAETTYPDRIYSNLWLIRLDTDGRCREFTEWWMQHP